MKVAIVHDQLMEFGGAERVLVELSKIYPEAPIYTSFYDLAKLGKHAIKFEGKKIIQSWAAKIPFFKKLNSPLRFMHRFIWESFDFSEFDLVISSSGGWSSHGIITKKPTIHICYLHTPPRHLYGYETAMELQRYWPIKLYAQFIGYFMRKWDQNVASKRPDIFVANSHETALRIKKLYHRDSHVIYPPVILAEKNIFLDSNNTRKSYYITVSRLARSKHIEIQVLAANKFGLLLKIVGKGRDLKYLKSIAGKNVSFASDITDAEFDQAFSQAKAFLNTAVDEEFGISAVEALGRGVPVIAYASGGLKETIKDSKNGFLIDTNTPQALFRAIQKMEGLTQKELKKMSEYAFSDAKNYSLDNFHKNIVKLTQNVATS